MSDDTIKTGPRDYKHPIGPDLEDFIRLRDDIGTASPISVYIPAECFQRKRPNQNSIAEQLANAIRMHDGFLGHSIVFAITPSPGGGLPERGGVIYVRT